MLTEEKMSQEEFANFPLQDPLAPADKIDSNTAETRANDAVDSTNIESSIVESVASTPVAVAAELIVPDDLAGAQRIIDWSKHTLNGKSFVFGPRNSSIPPQAIWKNLFFCDVFADVYNFKKSAEVSVESGNPFTNLKFSLYCAKTSIEYYLHNIPEVVEQSALKIHSDKMRTTLKSCVSILADACHLISILPITANDCVKLYEFLEILMSRLKSLRKGYSLLVPCGWISKGNGDKGHEETIVCLLLVSRTNDSHEKDFSVSIINTSGTDGGLMYHPQSVDIESGATIYNLSATLSNVANNKILNSAFW